MSTEEQKGIVSLCFQTITWQISIDFDSSVSSLTSCDSQVPLCITATRNKNSMVPLCESLCIQYVPLWANYSAIKQSL